MRRFRRLFKGCPRLGERRKTLIRPGRSKARSYRKGDRLCWTLKEALVNELSEDDYYRILESKSVWIQNRVSPILKTLSFRGEPGHRKLLDAIEHFKENNVAIDKAVPAGFLDPTERVAVHKDVKFPVSLYRVLLFLHVQSAIKSGAWSTHFANTRQ